MAGIRIDELDATVLPSRDHVVPAMKDGLTVKLTVGQILDLLGKVLDPDEVGSKALFAALNLSDLDDPEQARANIAALSYESQSLDSSQQAQARSNISAVGYEEQSLSPTEQSQARANIGAGLLAGFRNKIVNGDFDIWQRGTAITSGVYCADRWRYFTGVPGGFFSISRQAFPVGTTEVPGNPRYYARMELTQAATGGRPGFFQRIEGVRTLAGKKATLTAYVRLSVSANVEAYLIQNFGTGGSPTEQTPENNTYVEANSFQKVQHVIDVPPIIGKTIGGNNDDFLEVAFRTPEGFTGNFELAHVSLVEGDATAEADPFSPRHIEQEWLLCYRYYERAEDGAAGYLFNIPPARLSGSIIHRTHYPFKARKRVAPSQTYTVSAGTVSSDVATVDYGRLGANGVGSETAVQVVSAVWDAEL